MSESEIIQIEYQAIKKFCRGDKKLAFMITSELGLIMRKYIQVRHPEKITVDELCSVIETATAGWTS